MPTTTNGTISSRSALADPESYRQLEAEWLDQLAPRNLLERHYVEKIAAASWRLRWLHRWQAQLFEDETLTEDERLDKLDKMLRHETNLHRQIDTSVKMLNKDVPRLYAGRAHADPAPICQNEPAPASSSDSGSPPKVNGVGGWGANPSSNPSLTGRGGERQADTQSCSPEHSRGGSPSLTLTAKGRLVPVRTDAARRLLESA